MRKGKANKRENRTKFLVFLSQKKNEPKTKKLQKIQRKEITMYRV